MYIVTIAWLYVTVMMALAEATDSNGTLLGAVITLLLYGVLPVALLMYLMGSPARRKAAARRDAAAIDEDARSHAATSTQADAVAPVREEK